MEHEEKATEKELLCPYRVCTTSMGGSTTQQFYLCDKENCAAFYRGACLRAREPLINYLNRNKEDGP